MRTLNYHPLSSQPELFCTKAAQYSVIYGNNCKVLVCAIFCCMLAGHRPRYLHSSGRSPRLGVGQRAICSTIVLYYRAALELSDAFRTSPHALHPRRCDSLFNASDVAAAAPHFLRRPLLLAQRADGRRAVDVRRGLDQIRAGDEGRLEVRAVFYAGRDRRDASLAHPDQAGPLRQGGASNGADKYVNVKAFVLTCMLINND